MAMEEFIPAQHHPILRRLGNCVFQGGVEIQ